MSYFRRNCKYEPFHEYGGFSPRGVEMRKILYTVSAAAIALSAMTMDASARRDHNDDDNKTRASKHEKKIKKYKNQKIVFEKKVVRKRNGEKIVKHVVTVKKPRHSKKKIVVARKHRHKRENWYGRHSAHKKSVVIYKNRARKVVVYKNRPKKVVVYKNHPKKVVVYKKPQIVYMRPVVYRHNPRNVHYKARHRHEQSLPVLAMRLILKLTEHQLDMQRRATYQAASADVGEQIYWNESGRQGTVTTTREGIDSSGRTCREFEQTIEIGDSYETGYGIACRNRFGDWEMLP